MAIASTSMREDLAVRYADQALTASLHTADPGTTGASEVTGGSPAYARQTITWADGSTDGVVTGVATFDVPTGTTVTYVALWGASNVFKDKALVADAVFTSQGMYQLTLTFTQS